MAKNNTKAAAIGAGVLAVLAALAYGWVDHVYLVALGLDGLILLGVVPDNVAVNAFVGVLTLAALAIVLVSFVAKRKPKRGRSR